MGSNNNKINLNGDKRLTENTNYSLNYNYNYK